MKKAIKSATSQFAGFWGKPKPAKKAPRAKIKRPEPSPSDLVLAKYSGDPAIIAAHLAWGAGRLWPRNKVFEDKVAGYFKPSADKIIGVLGCGTGGAAVAFAHHIPSFIYGYDWRKNAEIPGTEFVRSSDERAKVVIRSISLDAVFPLQNRCVGVIVAEPALTRFQDQVLDWLRLALCSGGQVIFEEPSLEHGDAFDPATPWFADMQNEDCTWQSPAERQLALKRAGFVVRQMQETTGVQVLALRTAIQQAQSASAELDEAMELVPILEPVRTQFQKELRAARNRLNALENGDVAVYRYRAIKQRANR